MSDCLFCKISDGEISGDIVHQNDSVLAFNDINPQAPHHVLIIPRKHIPTTNDISDDDRDVLGEMYLAAKQIAAERGIADGGYRTVFNCNSDAGQKVYHIHLHLLGGRKMGWPPG
ncbi:MAG: histidine triad nucleotide-binding protein [Candidatus Marinimicrobia bacterium]|nr:histidine triad nucleotide-binding protein [Candidatus Neomarinimicrobiota bacterium]